MFENRLNGFGSIAAAMYWAESVAGFEGDVVVRRFTCDVDDLDCPQREVSVTVGAGHVSLDYVWQATDSTCDAVLCEHLGEAGGASWVQTESPRWHRYHDLQPLGPGRDLPRVLETVNKMVSRLRNALSEAYECLEPACGDSSGASELGLVGRWSISRCGFEFEGHDEYHRCVGMEFQPAYVSLTSTWQEPAPGQTCVEVIRDRVELRRAYPECPAQGVYEDREPLCVPEYPTAFGAAARVLIDRFEATARAGFCQPFGPASMFTAAIRHRKCTGRATLYDEDIDEQERRLKTPRRLGP